MTDELSILVVPEVESLGVGRGETLDGGHTTELHAHQLMRDPEGGREVDIQLDTLAHTRGNRVLCNTQVHSRLEPAIAIETTRD